MIKLSLYLLMRNSVLIFLIVFFQCKSEPDYKHGLLSDDVTTICKACYELGKLRDTSAVKLLLFKILDPRRSKNIQFKGMSVCYCKIIALEKIAGKQFLKDTEIITDTAAVNECLNWAIANKYIQNSSEINIDYYTAEDLKRFNEIHIQ